MESRPQMQGTHEVKSGEPATNAVIHTYTGNTRSMHKKFASVRIILENEGVLSQTVLDLHHEGSKSVMAGKENAKGASAKGAHWHFIVGLVAVLVIAAGLSLGVWTWPSHVKAKSLADCWSQATSAARSMKAYEADRAAAQRWVRAIPQDDVSDAKVVATVEKAANDEARTVKAHLDKAIADGDSLLSGSNGQVADNAVCDALKTVLDQVKVVQADTKADTNVQRKAIQDLDLASQMQAVNDSKAAKANVDREAADQQAQQAATAAPASSSGHTRGGSAGASGRSNGSRYARGGSRGGYTAPAPSSGGSGSSYPPAPDHYTQE